MSQEYTRAQRVGDLIQRELSIIIQREINDPRLRLINITRVKISDDLSSARIYVTQLVSKEQAKQQEAQAMEQTVKLLNKATKHLRYCLAQTADLRIVPQLKFFYDDTFLKATELSNLIDRIVVNNEEKDPTHE